MSRLPTSDSNIAFAKYLVENGVPQPVLEHKVTEGRGWRFDLAWPEYMVAVEIQGGFWTGGRHSRGVGAENDMEKYNWAQLEGWAVLLFTPRKAKGSGTWMLVQEMLDQRGGKHAAR